MHAKKGHPDEGQQKQTRMACEKDEQKSDTQNAEQVEGHWQWIGGCAAAAAVGGSRGRRSADLGCSLIGMTTAAINSPNLHVSRAAAVGFKEMKGFVPAPANRVNLRGNSPGASSFDLSLSSAWNPAGFPVSAAGM